MKVIGVGLGRTGTYSLRMAIDRLGLGPCYHMEDVVQNMPLRVPHWNAALGGHPDWAATFDGFESAVDWPTACFYRELLEAFPSAKFVLTERNPETWADSIGSTILKLLAGRSEAPEEMRGWLDMCAAVIQKNGIEIDFNREQLAQAFVAHNEAVKKAIPADKLLIYTVRQGWDPLCNFLGKSAPDEPFPRTNNREEFWDLVEGNM